MIVIDTSVAFKWFNNQEEGHHQALLLLTNHLNGKDQIAVPSLMFYEIANAWTTKSNLETTTIKNNLKLLSQYSIRVIELDTDLFQKAVDFAKDYHTTVYDSVYAVLAESKKCRLITADKKFAQKVNQTFIQTLDSYI